MLVIHRDVTGKKKIEEIARTFQGYVDDAADKAYSISLLDSKNPRLSRWIERATEYLETGRERMLPAYYGYAVEELTNKRIRDRHGLGIKGHIILLQRSEGHTRPDIILKNASGKTMAWMDITSKRSKGHIYRKDSKGWRDKPFVAELTYKRFKKTKIVPGYNVSIAARVRFRTLQKRLKMKHEKNMTFFKKAFTETLRYLWRKRFEKGLSQSRVASAIEKKFRENFGVGYKHPVIKSMIELYSTQRIASCDVAAFEEVKKLYKDTARNKAEAMAYISKACAKTLRAGM